jgi:hypothetical protein
MRTLIGWMAAMLASALLGAVVYENVLSKPVPASEQTASVEMVPEEPTPTPTVYRTKVKTVVDPTPTATVVDKVVIEEEVLQVSQPRTSKPAPARTSAPKPRPRATAEREKDDSSGSSDDTTPESVEAESHDSAESDD